MIQFRSYLKAILVSVRVLEAAHQSERILVRYNMSSRVTIDDLLGKVTLLFDVESQTTRLQFVNGL